MQRPTGVTIIAVLDFIGGAIVAIAGLLVFAGGSMLSGLLAGANAGAGSGVAAGLGAIVGVICLVFAALAIAIGIGLLKLMNWARILSVVLAALGILNTLRSITTIFHGGSSGIVVTLVVLAFDIWVIWYMFTPGVKAAFAGRSASPVAA